jgi:hypothetical protein
MKIEATEVYGFRPGFKAMRNPLDSWDKSDSEFGKADPRPGFLGKAIEGPLIGPNDLKLACKLIRGGSEHRKFLRQIIVWVDFTLPRYVWQELESFSGLDWKELYKADPEVDLYRGTWMGSYEDLLCAPFPLNQRIEEDENLQRLQDWIKSLPYMKEFLNAVQG